MAAKFGRARAHLGLGARVRAAGRGYEANFRGAEVNATAQAVEVVLRAAEMRGWDDERCDRLYDGPCLKSNLSNSSPRSERGRAPLSPLSVWPSRMIGRSAMYLQLSERRGQCQADH